MKQEYRLILSRRMNEALDSTESKLQPTTQLLQQIEAMIPQSPRPHWRADADGIRRTEVFEIGSEKSGLSDSDADSDGTNPWKRDDWTGHAENFRDYGVSQEFAPAIEVGSALHSTSESASANEESRPHLKVSIITTTLESSMSAAMARTQVEVPSGPFATGFRQPIRVEGSTRRVSVGTQDK